VRAIEPPLGSRRREPGSLLRFCGRPPDYDVEKSFLRSWPDNDGAKKGAS
jgi:hypothetical protein